MFRLSQLAPGTYVVVWCRPRRPRCRPHGLAGQDAALRTELFWAGVTEIAPLGQPRTQQVRRRRADDAEQRADSSSPVSGGPHGGVPDDVLSGRGDGRRGNARSRSKQARSEPTSRSQLRPVPAVRVSGRLVTPDGSPPPPTTIRLVGAAMTDVITSSTPSGQATSASRPSRA